MATINLKIWERRKELFLALNLVSEGLGVLRMAFPVYFGAISAAKVAVDAPKEALRAIL